MRANLVEKKQKRSSVRRQSFRRYRHSGKAIQPGGAARQLGQPKSFMRGLMEKSLGIHRDRLLPEFHTRTFAKWIRKRPAPPKGNGQEKVALFYTCTVN